MGPPRGKLGRFCPWGVVFGATAGQFGPFLPLGYSLWRHCGAIWAVFAPGEQSLEPPRGDLGRFCPWGGAFKKIRPESLYRKVPQTPASSLEARAHNATKPAALVAELAFHGPAGHIRLSTRPGNAPISPISLPRRRAQRTLCPIFRQRGKNTPSLHQKFPVRTGKGCHNKGLTSLRAPYLVS